MGIKINCVYNDKGAWCKHTHIKRSLWGIGARCCSVFNGELCSLQEEIPKPRSTPPPPQKKNIPTNIIILKVVNKNDI